MNKNKRGWITVLEATIAVLLVSGVLMIVYVRQGTDESPVQDYIFSLQKQILSDISFRSDLRTYVLEENEIALNEFVNSKVPPAYGYSVKICNLDGSTGFCKLNETEVIETREKALFIEELIVSAELDPTIPGDSIYEPKKVKLFIWENR
ncbi:MAG: hypothetical protein KKF50_03070 [Nanoarchaeota archaeon]|nr:hypothetical protein [Nanoarchaeota archaeon]